MQVLFQGIVNIVKNGDFGDENLALRIVSGVVFIYS
jgi:hypothetical protein